jgi:hypothetical protein
MGLFLLLFLKVSRQCHQVALESGAGFGDYFRTRMVPKIIKNSKILI